MRFSDPGRTAGHTVPGWYAYEFDKSINAATGGREYHPEFADVLNAAKSPVAARLARFEQGLPVILTRSEIGGHDFPFKDQLESVPFLCRASRIEHEGALAIRLHPDDRVELVETRQQRDQRVADELLPGYYDEDEAT
jgi:hypothetical protein